MLDDLDGFLLTRDVVKLTGYSRRWLYHLMKLDKFPQPDVYGGVGASHRWRRSTIKRALDGMGWQ